MEFQCSGCKYRSPSKNNVKTHINKKNPCGENLHIIEIKVNIQCDYCNKRYASLHGLKQHYKRCKVLKSNIETQLRTEIAELQKENAKLAAKPTTIINNNIVVNSYDKTDFTKLTDRHFSSAINKTLLSVPKMIEYTHFNDKIPENQNIYISNQKGKYAMVYDGKDWCIKDQGKTIDKLITDHEYELENWANSVYDRNPKYVEKYQKYETVKEKEGAEDVMKEEVKMLLYNKRNIVKSK